MIDNCKILCYNLIASERKKKFGIKIDKKTAGHLLRKASDLFAPTGSSIKLNISVMSLENLTQYIRRNPNLLEKGLTDDIIIQK